ncbi:MAG: recombination protein RecR [Candidatus Nealsonbacteria bacterium CG_4_8_14_3_um_filter_39_7]|uniref:Recombination protein RecR n=1 Tax=Candidatus Nealsonbacteria bacterium CG23_combo_of_CG06-09_8_20_14_all_39_17 TaxID=1974722 RepID=A0A2G9YTZ0_9BACT|nr:MAG: recombination protein RecR [Candidatus Nealsonbacteria bacterium CG23_combo_of_CG06-09_8_20_14_all_39_17]PIU44175.1 MAG: recombination protein RecR [Candidatus Nealsonbacteria bacterium CG07_land_8_20_14_0_80_39_13]PIW90975.1 MAG: recombination protein RecR [Candidatus Nealsonbacteria bacterium CG_4_8_14_3_um_filter_39_7]
MYSKSIQKLIELFSKFPTVGSRTAARFVFFLMKTSKEEIDDLVNSISALKNNVKYCGFCFNTFEGEGDFCEICSNPIRDKTLLCVVEKETDLTTLEQTKKYKGLYFVLGNRASAFKKEDVKGLRIKELEERVKSSEKYGIKADFKEIIIAINPTAEGEAASLYLERLLGPLGVKITRLGRGLPMGAELEYADEETLSSALETRK